MTIKFKDLPKKPKVEQALTNDYFASHLGIPFAPLGMPMGVPSIARGVKVRKVVEPPPLAMPGANLPRVLHYNADYGGCGMWRMSMPEFLLNANSKMIVNSLTTMVTDPRFYLGGWSAIKLQRQATPMQLEFLKMVQHHGDNHGFRIIYELDDIVFDHDIPMYNRCRDGFTDPIIQDSIRKMMDLCDEVLVVSEYMRDYYASRINNKKVSCIPNYSPKFWFGGKFNEDNLLREYEKNRKKPRILGTPSGTHFDVLNRTNQVDDYTHVTQAIIRSRKDFQWVFMGSFPVPLKPFIDNGEIEFIPWAELLNFPNAIIDTKCQATIAPLLDNHFNRSKSFIKFTESSYLGLPFVGQKMDPYKECFHQFDNGDEMVDHLKLILKDAGVYRREVKKAYEYADQYWLDDHLDEHVLMYTTNFGDPKRMQNKWFLKHNQGQFAPKA